MVTNLNGTIKIVVNKLNYAVTIPDMRYKFLIEYMLVRLSTYSFRYDYKRKKNVRQVDKIYASEDDRRLTYRFNINTIKNFMLTLGNHGIGKDQILITRNENNYASKMDVSITEGYILRDYQKTYVDIITNGDHPYSLVDLIMGYGKTVLSMYAVTKINEKTMILVLPKFIDKWVSDVTELADVSPEQILVIQGGDSLRSTIVEHIDEQPDYKFIIMSMRTMYNYIKEYETVLSDDEFSYPVTPQDLLQALGVGTLLNDETHMEFHSVFRSALYLNANKFIGLSATLENLDKNMNRMYNIMFPGDARISGIVEYVPYIYATTVVYEVNSMKRINYRRPQGYSHNLLEQSILRNNLFLRGYTDMILKYVDSGYIKNRTNGDKALIFVASIKLASVLVNILKRKYDYLTINRYVEDDPYENLMDADICVSTVLSSGTALDIPNLTDVFQTISIKSLQSVKQAYGRLRNLGEKKVRYHSFTCMNIPNHKETSKSNKEILSPLSKEWRTVFYNKKIRTV